MRGHTSHVRLTVRITPERSRERTATGICATGNTSGSPPFQQAERALDPECRALWHRPHPLAAPAAIPIPRPMPWRNTGCGCRHRDELRSSGQCGGEADGANSPCLGAGGTPAPTLPRAGRDHHPPCIREHGPRSPCGGPAGRRCHRRHPAANSTSSGEQSPSPHDEWERDTRDLAEWSRRFQSSLPQRARGTPPAPVPACEFPQRAISRASCSPCADRPLNGDHGYAALLKSNFRQAGESQQSTSRVTAPAGRAVFPRIRKWRIAVEGRVPDRNQVRPASSNSTEVKPCPLIPRNSSPTATTPPLIGFFEESLEVSYTIE